MDDEGGQDEEHVDQELVHLRVSIGIHLEFSQAKLILILERVEYPEVRELGHDFILFIQVDVDDVERTSEHQVAEDQDDQEGANACNGLLDQSDEEGCCIEQAEPVENLEPQEAYGDGWKGDLPFFKVTKKIGDHDETVYEQVDQVVHVPIVEEVVWVRLAVLPLPILAPSLVRDKDRAIAEQWVVEEIVSCRMLNVLLERAD